MKTWENASIEEISFEKTENGGMPSRNFDQQWFDENGVKHITFAS